MTEALLALPAHLPKRLERALDAGMVAPPYRPAAVDAAVETPADALHATGFGVRAGVVRSSR